MNCLEGEKESLIPIELGRVRGYILANVVVSEYLPNDGAFVQGRETYYERVSSA